MTLQGYSTEMVGFMLALLLGYLGMAAAVGLIVWYVVLFCKALITEMEERLNMNAREWLWFWMFMGLYVVASLLFGLNGLEDLPDVTAWDPTPQEEADLRDRLLRAGEARAGGPAEPGADGPVAVESLEAAPGADAPAVADVTA